MRSRSSTIWAALSTSTALISAAIGGSFSRDERSRGGRGGLCGRCPPCLVAAAAARASTASAFARIAGWIDLRQERCCRRRCLGRSQRRSFSAEVLRTRLGRNRGIHDDRATAARTILSGTGGTTATATLTLTLPATATAISTLSATFALAWNAGVWGVRRSRRAPASREACDAYYGVLGATTEEAATLSFIKYNELDLFEASSEFGRAPCYGRLRRFCRLLRPDPLIVLNSRAGVGDPRSSRAESAA